MLNGYSSFSFQSLKMIDDTFNTAISSYNEPHSSPCSLTSSPLSSISSTEIIPNTSRYLKLSHIKDLSPGRLPIERNFSPSKLHTNSPSKLDRKSLQKSNSSLEIRRFVRVNLTKSFSSQDITSSLSNHVADEFNILSNFEEELKTVLSEDKNVNNYNLIPLNFSMQIEESCHLKQESFSNYNCNNITVENMNENNNNNNNNNNNENNNINDNYDQLKKMNYDYSGVIPRIEMKGRNEHNYINGEILTDILHNDKYSDQRKKLFIFDCRFDYEYENGHIKNAIHCPPHNVTEKVNQLLSRNDKELIIVFYCEFSSKRAPSAYRTFRSKDREMNIDCYPQLSNPNIYVLYGGYRAFFNQFKNSCQPQAYVEMNDKSFSQQLSQNLKRKREAVLSFRRSK